MKRLFYLSIITYIFKLFILNPRIILAASPYSPSNVITSITWDAASHQGGASGSDLWTNTWGADDAVYTAFGDGDGFTGGKCTTKVTFGLVKITGLPPNYTATDYYCSNLGSSGNGKIIGMLSVGGTIYGWMNSQTSSTPYHILGYYEAGQWKTTPVTFNYGVFVENTFLNFGKDYAGVPTAHANYVYVYGAKYFWNNTQIYLARVPKTSITNQSAYMFYKGKDASGNPIWTANISERQPVFGDPEGTKGIFSVVYNPVLKRYIAGTVRDKGGSLSVYDAPEPWGPWTTVGYYTNWLGADTDAANPSNNHGLVYGFANKYTSSDGKTMWMIFSCYNCNPKYSDNFNIVKGTLNTSAVTNTPTTTGVITPTPSAKPGDANGDNKVDGLDYVVWLNHYNQSATGAANGDFNNSGKVDGLDYVIWLTNYGS